MTWALAFHSDMLYRYRLTVFRGLISRRLSHRSLSGAAPNLGYLSLHAPGPHFHMISGMSLRVPMPSTESRISTWCGLCYKSTESMSTWRCGFKYISDQFPIWLSSLLDLQFKTLDLISARITQIQLWLYTQLCL